MNYRNAIRQITLVGNTAVTIKLGEEGFRYILSGSPNMAAGAIAVSGSGTPKEGTLLWIKYEASPISYDEAGGDHITIFGKIVSQEIASSDFVAVAEYINAAWHVSFLIHYEPGTFVLDGADIDDGTIPTGKFAAGAIETADIADANVTNAKLADMADSAIKGRAIGAGTGVPTDLTPTQIRSILDQDVTLTGDVTGTATQIAATGVTTVSTALGSAVVERSNMSSDANQGVFIVRSSFEANEIGTIKIEIPFDCTVTRIYGCVTKLIEASNNGTVQLLDNVAATLTGSTLTFTAGWTAGLTTSSNISANNSFSAGDTMSIVAAKSTNGGTVLLSITYTRE